jgi:hypothetical protein
MSRAPNAYIFVSYIFFSIGNTCFFSRKNRKRKCYFISLFSLFSVLYKRVSLWIFHDAYNVLCSYFPLDSSCYLPFVQIFISYTILIFAPCHCLLTSSCCPHCYHCESSHWTVSPSWLWHHQHSNRVKLMKAWQIMSLLYSSFNDFWSQGKI